MKKESLKSAFIISIFVSLITIIFTITFTLISENKIVLIIFLILFVLFTWIFYNKYAVVLLHLEQSWWSPHIKKLNLDSLLEKKDFDPEIAILSYFIDKNYLSYQRAQINKNKGFIIGGQKGKQKIIGKFLKEKHKLEIKFYPTISKNSILTMEDFKKFISNFR